MTPCVDRPWFETAFGEHYPEIYAHRDALEARRCLDLLPRLASLGAGPVLDLGCGQGRHLPLLADGGLAPVGVDLSEPLLRRARREGPEQPLLRADMRAIPLRSRSCSAVLSLFTAFGYFGAFDDHLPVVTEIARVLQPGGHWYLDFLNSRRVADDLAALPAPRERILDDVVVREERRLAHGPLRAVKTVSILPRPGREEAAATVGIGPAGLRYREEVTLFSLDEFDDLAARAGLARVAAAGDYDGSPLDSATGDRWMLVYRRPTCGKDIS